MMKKIFLLTLLAVISLTACKKLDFTKTESPNPSDKKWMYYDNGTNFSGISASSGSSFDIAGRFSPSQLVDYDGYKISKIKFFPLVGNPTVYSVTIWEGMEPPVLLYYQEASVTIGEWNTASVNETFYVDATKYLWVGVRIQDYPSGTFPAGCDAGPAAAGNGDLYSTDGGQTWFSLYNTDGLNYNWNLQVLLESFNGQSVTLN